MFRLGAVTDEISADFERALAIIGGWGLEDVEIHTLWDTHIEALTDDEVARLQEVLARRGMRPAVLASTVFLRCRLGGGEPPEDWSERFHSVAGTYDDHLAWLERCLTIAQRLAAPFVRIFGFWPDGAPTEAVFADISARLREPVQMAADAGVTLALENCPHTCLDHTRRALRVLRAIDSPWLRLLWDPSNAYRNGEIDVVDTIAEALPYVAHVHVKGVIVEGDRREYTAPEKGGVDFRRLLRELLEAGYDGVVSMEPHYALPETGIEGAAQETFASLTRIIDSLTQR
jgi:L-ribulose-5-phosphate 3-epimerase